METQFWTTLEQEVQEAVRASNHLILEKLLSGVEVQNQNIETNLFRTYMNKVWQLHDAKRAVNSQFYYHRIGVLDSEHFVNLESKVTRLKNEKKQARHNWKQYLKEKEHV